MRVRSHNLRSLRLKARRRKIFIGKIIVVLFCLGSLWGLIFWLSGLEAVTVRDVEISGAVSVSSDEIASTAQKFLVGRYLFTVPRANILVYPKASIATEIIQSFPRIKEVKIRLENLHTLVVLVTEREAVGLWCRPLELQVKFLGEKWDDCYFLDSNGLIFQRLDLTSTSSPDVANMTLSSPLPPFIKFYGLVTDENPISQNYETPERFQSLLEFAKNINPLGLTVLAIRERDDRDLDVELLGDARLIVGRDISFASVISNLQAIILDPTSDGVAGFKKVDYIDMRYGNKVFYKRK